MASNCSANFAQQLSVKAEKAQAARVTQAATPTHAIHEVPIHCSSDDDIPTVGIATAAPVSSKPTSSDSEPTMRDVLKAIHGQRNEVKSDIRELLHAVEATDARLTQSEAALRQEIKDLCEYVDSKVATVETHCSALEADDDPRKRKTRKHDLMQVDTEAGTTPAVSCEILATARHRLVLWWWYGATVYRDIFADVDTKDRLSAAATGTMRFPRQRCRTCQRRTCGLEDLARPGDRDREGREGRDSGEISERGFGTDRADGSFCECDRGQVRDEGGGPDHGKGFFS